MNDIKNIIAKNIAELRQAKGMTQLELAEKLNYSDKTISKWERAESTPDISILIEIASIFDVTLDYLVTKEHTANPTQTETETQAPTDEDAHTCADIPDDGKDIHAPGLNRRAIASLSECCAWFVAVFAFVVTTLFAKQISYQFLFFVYALPVAFIVRLVFNSIWFNTRHNYYIISLLMWSVLASIHITFLYFDTNVVLIYLLGVAGQIAIVLWSFIRKPGKNPKK